MEEKREKEASKEESVKRIKEIKGKKENTEETIEAETADMKRQLRRKRKRAQIRRKRKRKKAAVGAGTQSTNGWKEPRETDSLREDELIPEQTEKSAAVGKTGASEASTEQSKAVQQTRLQDIVATECKSGTGKIIAPEQTEKSVVSKKMDVPDMAVESPDNVVQLTRRLTAQAHSKNTEVVEGSEPASEKMQTAAPLERVTKEKNPLQQSTEQISKSRERPYSDDVLSESSADSEERPMSPEALKKLSRRRAEKVRVRNTAKPGSKTENKIENKSGDRGYQNAGVAKQVNEDRDSLRYASERVNEERDPLRYASERVNEERDSLWHVSEAPGNQRERLHSSEFLRKNSIETEEAETPSGREELAKKLARRRAEQVRAQSMVAVQSESENGKVSKDVEHVQAQDAMVVGNDSKKEDVTEAMKQTPQKEDVTEAKKQISQKEDTTAAINQTQLQDIVTVERKSVAGKIVTPEQPEKSVAEKRLDLPEMVARQSENVDQMPRRPTAQIHLMDTRVVDGGPESKKPQTVASPECTTKEKTSLQYTAEQISNPRERSYLDGTLEESALCSEEEVVSPEASKKPSRLQAEKFRVRYSGEVDSESDGDHLSGHSKASKKLSRRRAEKVRAKNTVILAGASEDGESLTSKVSGRATREGTSSLHAAERTNNPDVRSFSHVSRVRNMTEPEEISGQAALSKRLARRRAEQLRAQSATVVEKDSGNGRSSFIPEKIEKSVTMEKSGASGRVAEQSDSADQKTRRLTAHGYERDTDYTESASKGEKTQIAEPLAQVTKEKDALQHPEERISDLRERTYLEGTLENTGIESAERSASPEVSKKLARRRAEKIRERDSVAVESKVDTAHISGYSTESERPSRRRAEEFRAETAVRMPSGSEDGETQISKASEGVPKERISSLHVVDRVSNPGVHSLSHENFGRKSTEPEEISGQSEAAKRRKRRRAERFRADNMVATERGNNDVGDGNATERAPEGKNFALSGREKTYHRSFDGDSVESENPSGSLEASKKQSRQRAAMVRTRDQSVVKSDSGDEKANRAAELFAENPSSSSSIGATSGRSETQLPSREMLERRRLESIDQSGQSNTSKRLSRRQAEQFRSQNALTMVSGSENDKISSQYQAENKDFKESESGGKNAAVDLGQLKESSDYAATVSGNSKTHLLLHESAGRTALEIEHSSDSSLSKASKKQSRQRAAKIRAQYQAEVKGDSDDEKTTTSTDQVIKNINATSSVGVMVSTSEKHSLPSDSLGQKTFESAVPSVQSEAAKKLSQRRAEQLRARDSVVVKSVAEVRKIFRAADRVEGENRSTSSDEATVDGSKPGLIFDESSVKKKAESETLSGQAGVLETSKRKTQQWSVQSLAEQKNTGNIDSLENKSADVERRFSESKETKRATAGKKVRTSGQAVEGRDSSLSDEEKSEIPSKNQPAQKPPSELPELPEESKRQSRRWAEQFRAQSVSEEDNKLGYINLDGEIYESVGLDHHSSYEMDIRKAPILESERQSGESIRNHKPTELMFEGTEIGYDYEENPGVAMPHEFMGRSEKIRDSKVFGSNTTAQNYKEGNGIDPPHASKNGNSNTTVWKAKKSSTIVAEEDSNEGGSAAARQVFSEGGSALSSDDAEVSSGAITQDSQAGGENRTGYQRLHYESGSSGSAREGSKDSFSGKAGGKRRSRDGLKFDDEESEMISGAGMHPGKRAAVVAAGMVSTVMHNRISEAEEDNLSVEAAHSAEQSAEKTLQLVSRRSRDKGVKNGRSLRGKSSGKHLENVAGENAENVTFGHLRFADAEESVEGAGHLQGKKAAQVEQEKKREILKFWQKKRYKRAYVAAATEKKQETQLIQQTQTVIVKVKRTLKEAVVKRRSFFAVGGLFLFMFVMIAISLSSCTALLEGGNNTFVSTTYPSDDADIYAVEDAYCALEAALQEQINSMESRNPGYDEYYYQIDEITHNPYHLISYFTAKYGQFTYEQVAGELKSIFQAQYSISLVSSTSTSADGETVTKLKVTVTGKSLDTVLRSLMDSDEEVRYDLYNYTYGNRSYLFDVDSLPLEDGSSSSSSSSSVSSEALSDEKFANMYAEAIKYLGVTYVWGGYSPSGFDCSGFVCWVINNCGNGWNVGRLTAEGLRSVCTYVSPDDAQPGDLIFFQGTYNTSGASHVGIYIGNSKMIHCGSPVQISSITTEYYTSHFLSFGRLP